MKINTDINILGGLPDFNLINVFLEEDSPEVNGPVHHYEYTAIKTHKSVKRFERAITETVLGFKNSEVETLVRGILGKESISSDSLLILFWNTSFNNELLQYLNDNVYFPAFYTGRMSIKHDEVAACIKELKQSEKDIQNWTDYTIEKVASKYLTLLKKFNLMEGTQNKIIVHPYLSDKMILLFTYWLLAIEPRPNILESQWLKYCFSEKPIFIERIMHKKFTKFIHLNYTGDNLKVDLVVSYQNIYDAITQS